MASLIPYTSHKAIHINRSFRLDVRAQVPLDNFEHRDEPRQASTRATPERHWDRNCCSPFNFDVQQRDCTSTSSTGIETCSLLNLDRRSYKNVSERVRATRTSKNPAQMDRNTRPPLTTATLLCQVFSRPVLRQRQPTDQAAYCRASEYSDRATPKTR